MNQGLNGLLHSTFPASTRDLALGVTVTSNASGSTANLVDGNDSTSSTFGTVAIPSSTWQFDLVIVRMVTSWRILQQGSGGGNFMSTYKWQWSNDASTWTDIATRVSNGGDETVQFSKPVRARYFRLVGIAALNNSGAAWIGYTVSLFGY